MSDQVQELLNIPRDFLKDGMMFINRSQKRECNSQGCKSRLFSSSLTRINPADKREFIKISQAVGTGFLVMGFIGYIVKLIHIPVNNVLVGGA
ncbi:hypothetical protein EYZ11_004347 [Aspergillus tanneri]|uniref:Sec61p translocation complex subunit n=1 Tax=Aspergillus tanneri TaxID=1220188 RepID=A0A4V3UPR4_9EURO|nr:hypothetical protein EYZ11_004347 [Aspergillus tanneri]